MSRAAVTLYGRAERERVANWAWDVPAGTRVEFKAPRRSIDQNSLMWQRLTDIAIQVEWYERKLNPEDWKDMFTASLRKARIVPGIDPGTYVALGMRTSDMTKEEMTALLDLIEAFGVERGVVFSDLKEEEQAA